MVANAQTHASALHTKFLLKYLLALELPVALKYRYNQAGKSETLFRCVHASLYEALSVRGPWSVGHAFLKYRGNQDFGTIKHQGTTNSS